MKGSNAPADSLLFTRGRTYPVVRGCW